MNDKMRGKLRLVTGQTEEVTNQPRTLTAGNLRQLRIWLETGCEFDAEIVRAMLDDMDRLRLEHVKLSEILQGASSIIMENAFRFDSSETEALAIWVEWGNAIRNCAQAIKEAMK